MTRRRVVAILIALAIVFSIPVCAVRRGASAPSGTSHLVLSQHIENLDILAREPMIVQQPDGSLFLSGYGGSDNVPHLWKSVDQGAHWSRVQVGGQADGAIGNSDVDLAVAQDGTLYFVSMGFNRAKSEGTHIAVGVSRDSGKTWKWNVVSRNRFDDRPWLAVAPNGTAHLIWNDGSGVYHAVTTDRGQTWKMKSPINSEGGSSHLAIGPRGEIAARIVPASASGNKFSAGTDFIAISVDGGETWTKRPVPGQRDWAPADDPKATPRWVEPVAWGRNGSLYTLWTEKTGVWLGRSKDRGVSWSKWLVSSCTQICYYPYLAAGKPGELAATWFSEEKEQVRMNVGWIRIQNHGREPLVVTHPPTEAEIWWFDREHPDQAPRQDTGGEYLAATFLRDSKLAVVAPIQNLQKNREGFSLWKFELPGGR